MNQIRVYILGLFVTISVFVAAVPATAIQSNLNSVEPAFIHGDTLILDNIIDNIKYSPPPPEPADVPGFY